MLSTGLAIDVAELPTWSRRGVVTTNCGIDLRSKSQSGKSVAVVPPDPRLARAKAQTTTTSIAMPSKVSMAVRPPCVH